MIEYVDSDFLRSSDSKFVIKVESLLKINNTLEEFTEKFQLDGITNGKLFVISRFNKYEFNCDFIIDNYLVVNNLIQNVDFAILYMPLTVGVKYEICDDVGKELNDTLNLNWIQSLLFVNEYLFWLVDDEKSDAELIYKILKINYKKIDGLGFRTPIIIKTDEGFVYYKFLNEDIIHRCFHL
jgi:hypothetical protein